MQGLTKRQQQVLDFITSRINEQGYPPTIREIGEEMGIRSTNGVNDHLKALERKGFLVREGLKSRALRPVTLGSSPLNRGETNGPLGAVGTADFGGVGASEVVGPSASPTGPGPLASVPRGDVGNVLPALIPDHGGTIAVPVLGRVAAGAPILADENVETTVQIDSFFLGSGRSDKVFALRVSGESMIDAGIFDGDYIFVRKQLEARRGDIVVAMIDGEATVKRYEPDGDVIRFVAENANMGPIVVRKSDFRSTSILGIVCGVYRRV